MHLILKLSYLDNHDLYIYTSCLLINILYNNTCFHDDEL